MDEIFKIVKNNLEKNNTSKNNLSDTWQFALNRRNDINQNDYENMLSPFSKAGRLISDNWFRADMFSLEDFRSIIKKYNLKESSFGNPLKKNIINGECYSNLFIRFVRIFKKLDDLINSEFRHKNKITILEIGSGLGVLPAILKNFYGDKITLLLVDIPEILSLQEYHLRRTNSNSKFEYLFGKKGEKYNIQNNSQVTFINAYNFKEFSFNFDIAINISSFAEMLSSTVKEYLDILSKNSNLNSIIFSINNSGHTANSYKHIDEFPISDIWQLKECSHVNQLDLLASDEIFICTVFQRKISNKKIIKESLKNLINDYTEFNLKFPLNLPSNSNFYLKEVRDLINISSNNQMDSREGFDIPFGFIKIAQKQNDTRIRNSIYYGIIFNFHKKLIAELEFFLKDKSSFNFKKNRILRINEKYMFSDYLFNSSDFFWFQQYSLSISIALRNYNLIEKQINLIKLLNYSEDTFVDFYCLLNSDTEINLSLLDKFELKNISIRNIFRLLICNVDNDSIVEEFLKRYLKNKNEYKKYLILLGKYKNISKLPIFNYLQDTLIYSDDIDSFDFLSIIIRNSETLNNIDIFRKANNAIKTIKHFNPLIAYEALVVISLFSKKRIENLLEEEYFNSLTSKYYELAGFANILSKYGQIEKSSELINKSLSLVKSNSEHRHLYYCAKILMKNGNVKHAKKLCEMAYKARSHIKCYYFSYLICKNLEKSPDDQFNLMWNNINLIFQGEHRHFCDYDYVSRF